MPLCWLFLPELKCENWSSTNCYALEFIYLLFNCNKMVNTLAVSAQGVFKVKWISISRQHTWILQITVQVPASRKGIFTPDSILTHLWLSMYLFLFLHKTVCWENHRWRVLRLTMCWTRQKVLWRSAGDDYLQEYEGNSYMLCNVIILFKVQVKKVCS